MMKKLLSIMLLSVFSVVSTQAQSVAKAKDILNKVSEKYKSFKTIKADFTYTLEIQSEKFKEEQKGTIYTKGKKLFKLEMNNQTVICDGTNLWTYLKDANEVQINKYDPNAMDINPAEIFTMYEKGFLYAYMGDETLDGKTVHLIELTPTDKKQSFYKVKLYVDKTGNTVSQAKIFEKNGNIYTYHINNFQPNVSLAENFFSFEKSKHPKVEVVDLR